MKLKSALIFLGLAIVSVGWFVILIPWNLMPDPDAIYHAVMANLIWNSGPVRQFPWLDLTSLGKHFADQHYLFHVLESPFVHYFGLLTGSRISSIVFATFCVLTVALVFKLLELKPFWFWTLVLFACQPFNSRLVQGKASPLAITLWFIGLAVASQTLVSEKKKQKFSFLILFIVSVLFTLSHGGWIMLPICLIAYFVGHALYCLAIDDVKPPYTKYASLFGWAVAGNLVGLILHPGRSQLMQLLWTQIVQIAIATPYQLHMGMEWAPASFVDAVGVFSLPGVVLLLCLLGFIFSAYSLNKKFVANSLAFGVVMAILFAMTLKSLRFAEYLQPVLVLWTAGLASLIDWKKLWQKLSMSPGRFGKHFLPIVVGICIAGVTLGSLSQAYANLHDAKIFKDTQYAIPMRAISKVAQPGDRVFHAQWDEFPTLWMHDTRLKYISGLDPTFLYVASGTLALDYADLAFNPEHFTNDQIYNIISQRMGAKFIMIDPVRWATFSARIASDSRYKKLAEGDEGIAYLIVR